MKSKSITHKSIVHRMWGALRLFGLSSQAGHGRQLLLLAFESLVQSKVKVRRCWHGIKNVGLVWYEQVWKTKEHHFTSEQTPFQQQQWLWYRTSSLGDELHQGEVPAVQMLQVVFLQSLLDHVGSFVLAGQLRYTTDENDFAVWSSKKKA